MNIEEQEVVPDQASVRRKRARPHVALIITEREVDAVDAPDLTRFVVQPVQRARRHTVAGGKVDALFEHDIDHARRELPAEAATLEDERAFARARRFARARPGGVFAGTEVA